MSADPTPNAETRNDEIRDSDTIFGRVVVPVPNQNKAPKKGRLGFEYMEHCFIGDSCKLTLANGQQVAASDHKFQLPNGLSLTYGQINGLSGDFYGTKDPISDGTSDQDRSTRFVNAYNTLAVDQVRQPKEATEILAVLQAEVDAVNEALANHQDPSVAYSKLPDVSFKLQRITWDRKDLGYLGLARINWDHFGADARTAYNAGHATAIQRAIDGDLEGAYALNAFADHFLEDSFSAGHLRTPRRLLHKSGVDISADACAKFMHDEDCAIGLSVANPAGERWTCYGDKRALDTEDEENLKRCVKAVQASADEVHKAFKSKTSPAHVDYAAWQIAPTLDSARATSQALATLFTFKNERRKTLSARRVWNFKSPSEWWFWSTALDCKTSGLWNYPITLNGYQYASTRWTDISVISPQAGSPQIFYQSPSGSLLSIQYTFGWMYSDDSIADAVLYTSIASVDWNGGSQIRLYYLDHDYVLQEYCYSEGNGWYPGTLGGLYVTAAYNSRLSAAYISGNHIRVYLQEEGSLNIQEVCYDDGQNWSRGPALAPALGGTSIAAVPVSSTDAVEIRVYFQKEDSSLVEYCYDQSSERWYQGDWSPGKVPGGSPIGAVAWHDDYGSKRMQVYWLDISNNVFMQSWSNGAWDTSSTVLSGGLTSGFQFSVSQWNQGTHLRVYWQGSDNTIHEQCSDNGGQSWYRGSLSLGQVG